jgi:GT2 family glycosyltransferase
VRPLAVIPVYGRPELTDALLGDLARERVGAIVVDNGGDYSAPPGVQLLRPGRNLGWAGGTNLGIAAALDAGADSVLCLNNDVRLSEGFVAALCEAQRVTRAGIVAPLYDCHWPQQRLRVSLAAFEPVARHHRVPFVDGTAMLVSAQVLASVGLLDADTYAPYGYGAEIDLCVRARRCGFDVIVTNLAFLHHDRGVTARDVVGDDYERVATEVMLAALERRWGPEWQVETGLDRVWRDDVQRTWRERAGDRRWELAQRLDRAVRRALRPARTTSRGRAREVHPGAGRSSTPRR